MSVTVGIFDSGVGGLTVARAVLRKLPGASILYYADNAYVPYGGRPLSEICTFATEIVRFLASHGAQIIAVGCNMSSIAIEDMGAAASCPVPKVTTLGPGARRAAALTKNGVVGVIATLGTVRSRAFTRRLLAQEGVRRVLEVPCPAFVPLTERGELDSPDAFRLARRYLEPLRRAGVDTVIYGCTHYPLLERPIRAALGDDIALVDPAEAMAEEVARLADGRAAQRSQTGHHFFASGTPNSLRALAPRWLGAEVNGVAIVDVHRRPP